MNSDIQVGDYIAHASFDLKANQLVIHSNRKMKVIKVGSSSSEYSDYLYTVKDGTIYSDMCAIKVESNELSE